MLHCYLLTTVASRGNSQQHLRVAGLTTCWLTPPLDTFPLPLRISLLPQPEHDMHWAADMALRLLQSRHASKHSKLTSSDNNSSSSDHPAFWVPWVDSLPQQVVTPVEFTSAEVQQLVIPSTVQVCV